MALRLVSRSGQQPQAPQPQQMGLIPSLAKPFVKTGQNIGGGLFELLRQIPLQGAMAFNKPETAGRVANIPNPFMSESTLSRYNPSTFNLQTGNPLEEQLRNSSAVASYAIPFGRGANIATKALIPGFASGTLGAASQEGATGSDLLKGGAFGTLTAGILQKLLGGGGSKVAQEATEQAGKPPTITGKGIKATPSFSSTRDDLANFAGEIGITDPMPSNQKVAVIDKAFQKYQDDILAALKDAPPVPATTVQAKFVENIERANIDQTAPQVQKELKKAMAKVNEAIGDNIKLNEVKSLARKEMGNAFTKGGVNNTPRQEVWGAIYDTIKDSLDTVPGDIRGLNFKQKQLFDLADEFVPQAVKSSQTVGVNIPFTTGATIPTPVTREGFRGFFGGAGRMAAAPFKAAGTLATKGGEGMGIPQAPGAVGPVTKGALATMQQGGGAQPQAQPETVPNFGGSLVDTLQPEAGRGDPNDEVLNTLLQLAVIKGDVTPASINALRELGGLPKKETAAQAKARADLESFGEILNQMEGMLADMPGGVQGLLPSLASRLPGARILGIGADRQAFRALKKAYTGRTARVIGSEVGALTDQDNLRMEDILPDEIYSPEVNRQRIEVMNQALSNLMGGTPMSIEGEIDFGRGAGGSSLDLESLTGLL